jgi:hypothetical protein
VPRCLERPERFLLEALQRRPGETKAGIAKAGQTADGIAKFRPRSFIGSARVENVAHQRGSQYRGDTGG